jgi:hypothetical protein
MAKARFVCGRGGYFACSSVVSFEKSLFFLVVFDAHAARDKGSG